MLCADDGDEGEWQQTKAVHPGKSIVHNIGFGLCARIAHKQIHTRKEKQIESDRDSERTPDEERGSDKERDIMPL